MTKNFLQTSNFGFKENTEPLTLHDGGRYHIETSPFICRANQWPGFYMITLTNCLQKNHIESFKNFVHCH